MPEHVLKLPRSASPVARAGAGDISERELVRERHNLLSTPPARFQPVHPKKQLFLTPVNKFTASRHAPSHLERLRGCLQEYTDTPARKTKMPPKAASMEDLTPTKRMKKENSDTEGKSGGPARSVGLRRIAEEEAAARVARFMVVSAWRRRREEVRCVRKTLEFQVSCSERLRLQVCTLKSLLDSDNVKVRLAMRELERLKQLLKDKDAEKAVLEREKTALEADICDAEDRASELSIGWRNCRNELEGVRAAAAVCEHALALERAATAGAAAQRDHAYARLSLMEEDLSQQEELLAAAEKEVRALRHEADRTRQELDALTRDLRRERESHAACERERAARGAEARALRAEVARTRRLLAAAHEQLRWWPAPLTRMMGAMRWWLRQPLSLPAALMWSSVPAAHGCTHLAGALHPRRAEGNTHEDATASDEGNTREDATASDEGNTREDATACEEGNTREDATASDEGNTREGATACEEGNTREDATVLEEGNTREDATACEEGNTREDATASDEGNTREGATACEEGNTREDATVLEEGNTREDATACEEGNTCEGATASD